MLFVSETATAAPPREGSVLLVAAGAAFLALLDTTVANLAVADVRSDFAGASVERRHLADHDLRGRVRGAARPGGAGGGRGRAARAAARGRRRRSPSSRSPARSLPRSRLLLVSRALQGAAAAAMIPASLAVVLADAPPERRARGDRALERRGALAAAAGPAIGGDARRHGRLARAVPGQRAGRHRDRRGHAAHPALSARRGSGSPTPSARCCWARGSRRPRSGSPRARTGAGATRGRVGALIGAVVAVALALWRSTRHAVPAIETALWRSRPFATANLASLLYGAALFPWMLVGVLFLIAVWGYSPLEAGLAMTPGALVAAVVALRAGPGRGAARPVGGDRRRRARARRRRAAVRRRAARAAALPRLLAAPSAC